MASAASADAVVAELEAERSDAALASVRRRLAPTEEAFGVRMGVLFSIAKRHTGLPLGEVVRLLAQPAYEPRLAALCILDFKARRKRIDGHGRGTLAEDRGIRCVVLDYDALKGIDDAESRLF